MGRYPSGPKSCVSDPSCDVLITKVTHPAVVTVFCYWGFVLLVCCSFQILKLWLIRKNPVKPVFLREEAPKSSRPATGSEGASRFQGQEFLLEPEEAKELLVTGYTWSYFGEFCYCVCCLTSLHWLALYVVILFDTYNKCDIGGIDNLCFFGNYFIFGTYELNAKVFFTVWWLSVVWYTTWVLFKGRVHNWFRLPCPLSQATVAFVWARDREEILSANAFALVYIIRRFKNIIMPPDAQGHFEIVDILETASGKRYFLFEGLRVLVDGSQISHARIQVGALLSDFHQSPTGLSAEDSSNRLEHVGLNKIPFEPEPLFQSICDELFTFFHVYQLIMYILQYWNSYLFVAALMTCIVLLSSSITIYTRRRSQYTIAEITKIKTDAEVLRGGSWTTVDASLLVPGDMVRVKSNWLLPCDFLILQGSCITDESALTGEAMPVQKYAAPNVSLSYQSQGNGARHTLFSGTTVLQAGSSGEEVRAIVAETGMNTSKGQILSSILYPQKMIFKYDEELPIVAFFLVLYGIVCFAISIVFQNHAGAQSYWVTKWIYCMAISRGIFCLNPKRIAIAGKIRVFCFDKTGTLTKEGLDFVGVHCVSKVENENSVFEPVVLHEKRDIENTTVLHGLATCHALSKFEGIFVGNQVEVNMFKSVGWDFYELDDRSVVVRSDDGKELKVVRRNEFDHARATMSVIVQDERDEFHIYCKGSFERIQELSKAGTLPLDYISTAQAHALEGCYVLSLGYRKLSPSVSPKDVLALSREEVEKELDFIALVLFRNELKPGSKETIRALKEGEIRPIMLTGDNAQCGHYIAKQSGMVSSHVQVLVGDVVKERCITSTFRLVWSPVKAESSTHRSFSEVLARPLSTEEILAQHIKGLEGGIIELAVTGKAFNLLRTSEAMDRLLLHTRIFARFTPSDKARVATMLRDRGLIIGMCGDGGNDCGALRAAHAGIALSEAEASVVSPFTSKDKSIESVVDLLREGRAALHTSFACYKFLIIYGLMFSILKLCAYWYGIIPCQMDYFFIDGVAVLTLGYAMTLSYPEAKLGKDRPTSSLLGAENVASVLGIWIINLCFLIAAVVMMANDPNYVKWPASFSHEASWWTLSDNWESTVLFFTMYFQFITSAFVFTFGSGFRKNVFNNHLLIGSYAGLVILFSFLLLLPHSSLTSLWHVASEQFNRLGTDSPVWILYQKAGGNPSPAMPLRFRRNLWLIIIASMIGNCLWQKLCVDGFIAKTIAKNHPSKRPTFHL
ncbi:hypothetical protein SELMODRAFT_439526 [Selaginella moellendorffii]|uniref:Cation-transporting P-type ATPase N-terminal domain-containing protein n=1 Tax=Selaginella moellendorffii TaxID=88036 RepID=D8R5P0_SELML|nr:hypothetical protein SELMODRAFT_439526 [Selaginella moellendorffii]